MARYQYRSAHEWLLERIDDLGEGATEQIIHRLSADDIQEMFQHEMDADGYFKDLDAYATCGGCDTEYEKSEMRAASHTTTEDDMWWCEECANDEEEHFTDRGRSS